MPDFWRGRVGTDAPVRAWNVVPFRALVYAFVMDADSRKIFGTLSESMCRYCFFKKGAVYNYNEVKY